MALPAPRSRLALTGRALLLGAVLALVPTLSGCVTDGVFGSDPDNRMPDDVDFARGEQVYVPAFDMLWERARQTLRSEGFGIDQERSSYAERRMVSRWRTRLAPTRFEGERTRVIVDIEEFAPKNYSVGVAVQKQRNEDITAPLNPAEAEWVEQPTLTDRARVYRWKIESFFRENDLYPDEGDGR